MSIKENIETITGTTSINEQDSLSSHKDHVFSDPAVATYYRNLYEEKKYEGRHMFDPEFEWTQSEERKVVRKTDLRVTLWVFVGFFALNLDRFNLQQALADDLLKDLKLTQGDYNIGNTVNLVCFLASELPSQLISKMVGPDIWIPCQMVLWSVVTIVQCKITNRSGFLATRAFLGLLEGGFIPDVMLWFSYFYTGREIPFRATIFYTAMFLSSIISSLLSFGIFHLRGVGGWEGWRWLFLIEGLVTLLIGFASFFMMPASITQTKAPWRPKGWYTHREEKIMVNRILRDDPQKGDMHNREAVSLKGLYLSLIDYDMWPVYLMRFSLEVVTVPLKNYASLIIRGLGFNPFDTALLLIPYSAAILVQLFIVSGIYKLTGKHYLAFLYFPIWAIGPLLALRFWPGNHVDGWGTYALLTVILSSPFEAAISVSWCNINSNSVRLRTVSGALLNMCTQLALLAGANVYQQPDAPLYHKGNSALIGMAFANAFFILSGVGWYKWRNARKEKAWNKLTEDEKQHYRLHTKDTGNKRLDFRFAL